MLGAVRTVCSNVTTESYLLCACETAIGSGDCGLGSGGYGLGVGICGLGVGVYGTVASGDCGLGAGMCTLGLWICCWECGIVTVGMGIMGWDCGGLGMWDGGGYGYVGVVTVGSVCGDCEIGVWGLGAVYMLVCVCVTVCSCVCVCVCDSCVCVCVCDNSYVNVGRLIATRTWSSSRTCDRTTVC